MPNPHPRRIIAVSLSVLLMLAGSAAASSAAVVNPGQPAGQSPTAVPEAAVPTVTRASGSFQALLPARVLDTRTNTGAAGPIGAGTTIALTILGAGGVPSTGVAAVAITVTVTRPTSPGYLTVYPDHTGRPVVSSLDFAAGQTVPNLVVAPVGIDGKILLYNGSAGSVALVGDVAGYYAANPPAEANPPEDAGALTAVTPTRILDTRIGLGAPTGAVAGSGTVALKVAGAGGLPASGMSAVLLNVTVTRPTTPGYLTVYADGSLRPGVSNLDFASGQTVANLVVVPMPGDGWIHLFNGSAGTTEMVADVAGYYLGGYAGVAGAFQPAPPTRILDTRIGLGAPTGALGPNRSITLQVNGARGLQRSGVSSVIVNVTAVAPTVGGFLTVYPGGSSRPNASNLDFGAGQTAANLVMVPLGPGGRIQLFYGGGGTVGVLADVVGFTVDGTGAARCNSIPLDPSGTEVTRWNPIVSCILQQVGQPAGEVGDVDTIIQYESSGDPNAINLWDSNAKAGHPSEGLIQVIKPTFEYYRTMQLPNDLYNPAANLYAGLHYAVSTYGSIHNVPGLVSLRAGGPYVGYIVHA